MYSWNSLVEDILYAIQTHLLDVGVYCVPRYCEITENIKADKAAKEAINQLSVTQRVMDCGI